MAEQNKLSDLLKPPRRKSQPQHIPSASPVIHQPQSFPAIPPQIPPLFTQIQYLPEPPINESITQNILNIERQLIQILVNLNALKNILNI